MKHISLFVVSISVRFKLAEKSCSNFVHDKNTWKNTGTVFYRDTCFSALELLFNYFPWRRTTDAGIKGEPKRSSFTGHVHKNGIIILFISTPLGSFSLDFSPCFKLFSFLSIQRLVVAETQPWELPFCAQQCVSMTPWTSPSRLAKYQIRHHEPTLFCFPRWQRTN